MEIQIIFKDDDVHETELASNFEEAKEKLFVLKAKYGKEDPNAAEHTMSESLAKI